MTTFTTTVLVDVCGTKAEHELQIKLCSLVGRGALVSQRASDAAWVGVGGLTGLWYPSTLPSRLSGLKKTTEPILPAL